MSSQQFLMEYPQIIYDIDIGRFRKLGWLCQYKGKTQYVWGVSKIEQICIYNL